MTNGASFQLVSATLTVTQKAPFVTLFFNLCNTSIVNLHGGNETANIKVEKVKKLWYNILKQIKLITEEHYER